MSTVTYGGVRIPTATSGKSKKVKLNKSFFARFMDALVETRLREARRVIEHHAHLLASVEMLSIGRNDKR